MCVCDCIYATVRVCARASAGRDYISVLCGHFIAVLIRQNIRSNAISTVFNFISTHCLVSVNRRANLLVLIAYSTRAESNQGR